MSNIADNASANKTHMLDHIGYPVANIACARIFYSAVLKPLGYDSVFDPGDGQPYCGFGPAGGNPQFWIWQANDFKPGTHIAFIAKTRSQVNEFYEAALQAGGRDNGPPGLRPHYHQHYYGAFVYDLDGYNIEAVCHQEE
jgi:catechol 2,3-dioxygenase-like lactoylglutathione lyase family enzyme